MAEYKGLTIRIGGDTSQLNSALKSSTKAASSLQSQIRQITRAMRFDPGNLANVDTRMKLTTDRAEALYSKLTLLKSGYQELGESTVTVGGVATSVKNLAETTENTALAATTAKERYNDMTASLAANYRELEARAKKAGQEMNLNALSRQGTDETFETQMAALKELGVVTDAEIDKLRTMRAVWNEAFNNSEAYKAAAQLDGMAVDMQRFESEARNAASTVRELNTVSNYSAENWQEATAKIRSMDSALEACAKQAREYEAALREDPSNMDAALGRLRALSNEYDLAASKASELSQQVEAYKGRLSGVLAEHKNLPLYIQEVSDNWEKVQNDLAEAKGHANALHQSLQRLKDAQAPVEEIKQLEAEVREADARVDALRQSASLMDEAFETAKECAELQRLQGELSETTARAKSLTERMSLSSLGGKSFLNASTIKSAGMTMYSTLTPAITMLGWRAVTAAQDIDTAYRDMRKTVDGTETQFEELKEAAIEFSKTHVTSADQILQIEAIGGELGIATENLQAFAETVSNLDVATNLSTDEAASSLGKLANITHMGAEEYDNYADALVRLGNNGASTEDQIVDIATRIGSMGTIVGMTVPEILALSSSIASTGMKTEASGTAIANTLSDMESAVAAGGDSLEAFATVSGMSAEKFAETWENEPIAAFQAFIEGLNAIEESGGSADATLEEMGITGTRQKQAILGLMQTIGGLNDNLTMSRDAWEGQSDAWGMAGDAAREAQKKAEGFSGQISILSNIANDAMASLAEGATPIIGWLTDVSRSALDLFESMDEGSKTAVVALLGIGAGIGPILTIAATFITAKQNISKFITESTAMGKAMKLVKEGFSDTSSGVSDFSTKMLSLKEGAKTVGKALLKHLAMAGVIAGITLAVAAITDFITKMKNMETASQSAGDVLSGVFDGVSSDAASAFGDTAKSFDDMVAEFAKHNETIRSSAEETYGNAANIEEYGQALKDALSAYNEGDRSQESLARLKTALDLYNGAAGESITLTEDETGALQLMKDDAALTADEFDRLTKSIVSASKAKFFEDAYTQKYADQREALDALTEAQQKQKEAQDALLNNTDPTQAETLSNALINANEELEKQRGLYESNSKAAEQYKEGMELMTEAQLENASGAVKWVAENDALQAAIWSNGESVSDFAHALGDLGISYDDLASNTEGFTDLATSWDGSIGNIVASLAEMGYSIDLNTTAVRGLNAVKIDGKTYWVDDQGTILEQDGKLSSLQAYTVGNKTYYVDDNGTVYDSKGRVENLTAAIHNVPANTNANVNTYVSGADAVFSLANTLSNLTSHWWNIGVSTTSSATGSIASSPYIPKHARGYVATGPTLTNNGWVGEAGAEAVLNWGTGGTVVPLTNTKYMRPIADAIASEMGGSRHSNVVVNMNLNYDASDDAQQMLRDIERGLENYLNLEA